MARTINNKYENLFRWMSNKLRLQDKFYKNDQRSVKYPRGAIYTCHLGENIGHEKSRLEKGEVFKIKFRFSSSM
ncbi:MAG: hypothetical protein IJA54_07330 [Tyzzerella sp.]|nr:hypothetical protein [Tyzzerella sp.]